MRKSCILACLFLTSSLAHAAPGPIDPEPVTTSRWAMAGKTDAFRGGKYSEFRLTGKFLAPPSHTDLQEPVMVVDCQEGERRIGKWVTGGKFLQGYIMTGAVLASGLTSIPVQYRLDGGKVHTDVWTPSTNLGSIFFAEDTLNTLLYGHFMPHKDGTNPPVRKLTVAVDEYMASETVAEFDLPDPQVIGNACGADYHKK